MLPPIDFESDAFGKNGGRGEKKEKRDIKRKKVGPRYKER